MSTMAGVSRQDGIDYPTQAPGFIPVFSGVRVAHLFSFVYIYIYIYTCLTPIPRFALRDKVTLRLLKLLF
jgi:hypothetical protein